MKKYEIIAVDFDGTLCSDCYPDIGKPNLPLIELLKALKREGCRIVLWTCRCGRELEQAVPVSYTHLDVYKRQGYH